MSECSKSEAGTGEPVPQDRHAGKSLFRADEEREGARTKKVLQLFRHPSGTLPWCSVSTFNNMVGLSVATQHALKCVATAGANSAYNDDDDDDGFDDLDSICRLLVFFGIVPAVPHFTDVPAFAAENPNAMGFGLDCEPNEIAFAHITPRSVDGRETFGRLVAAGIDFAMMRCYVKAKMGSLWMPHYIALRRLHDQWLLLDGSNKAKVGLLPPQRAADALFSRVGQQQICRLVEKTFKGGCRFADETVLAELIPGREVDPSHYPFLVMPKRVSRHAIVHECNGTRLPPRLTERCPFPRARNRSAEGVGAAAAVEYCTYYDLLDVGENERWLERIVLPEPSDILSSVLRE
jgi:hypothetical protein